MSDAFSPGWPTGTPPDAAACGHAPRLNRGAPAPRLAFEKPMETDHGAQAQERQAAGGHAAAAHAQQEQSREDRRSLRGAAGGTTIREDRLRRPRRALRVVAR